MYKSCFQDCYFSHFALACEDVAAESFLFGTGMDQKCEQMHWPGAGGGTADPRS